MATFGATELEGATQCPELIVYLLWHKFDLKRHC